MIISIAAEAKSKLMDRVVLMDDGTHPMKIIGVGNYDTVEDNAYFHLSSLTKKNPTKNGGHPVQYCGWFHYPHLKFQD